MTTTKDPAPDWDADLQVYEPHRAGLPKIGTYARDLSTRLPFAAEFSRSGIKAAHSQTVFGQLWLVLNPLLLALVYFFLVSILRGNPPEGEAQDSISGLELLAHIVAGLFVYYYVAGSMSAGAGSVTGGGKLIMNMAFPRLLMPMAAVRTAFFRFLPTLPVYLIIHAIAGGVWSWSMLLGLVFLALITLFSVGAAAIVATLQVYFRDTSSFLPYILRIWLYVSPILWTIDKVRDSQYAHLEPWFLLNPLYPLIGGWTSLTLNGQVPEPQIWIAAVLWAVVTFVAGSLFFMSRERDFAVRL